MLINLATFVIFALDKFKARVSAHRISEKVLWMMSLLGGTGGALLAMNFFRHKTKKLSFQTVLAIIFLLQIWLVYWLIKS